MPGLDPTHITWRGTKILGVGDYGKVGLWECEEQNTTGIKRKLQVAVKEMIKGPDFTRESKIMGRLHQLGLWSHIVRLLHNVIREDDGKIHRIVIEYCPQG